MIYTVEEITTKLIPIFERYKVTKAILFGSYAKGTATERSDIDIVVDIDPKESALNYFGVLGRMKEIFDKDVDLVPQMDIIPNQQVDIEVSQSGVVIYERT
jgi:predicted nucleotidyltransferase